MAFVVSPDVPLRRIDPGVDFGRWEAIEPYFDELKRRPLHGAPALEDWLLDLSELHSALEEERNVREVEMTCQTDDPVRERRYLDFIENILPKARVAFHELDRKLLASSGVADLPSQRFGVLLRRVRNRVELFREENVPLHTQDETLRQRYQKITGCMTVWLDGEELTLEQAARRLEWPDRGRRREAWEATWERRLRDRETLEDLFDEMIRLRDRAYAFRDLERFDYGPDDCLRFHAAVERFGVPAARALHSERQATLGVDRLRPWDTNVDPRGRSPLQPFSTADELVERCGRVFRRIADEFGAQFDRMRREGLLDLASRKGKAPGGYMTVFELRRLPFIFMNAVGVHRDVETLLHEGGHAFHAFATRGEPLHAYRNPPIEFAEVASMGMELLGLPLLGEFYDKTDLARAAREQFEGITVFFPWMATIDAFQHWLYTNPGHDRAARRAVWLDLRRRFGGLEDYAGHEEALAFLWQRQLHPFTVPFYYVEYGIAQLGALQVWQHSRRDFPAAVAAYRAALALGGSRPLPELFAAAGARFDFSQETFAQAMQAVQEQTAGLCGNECPRVRRR
jgi:oligoendopeptidase F